MLKPTLNQRPNPPAPTDCPRLRFNSDKSTLCALWVLLLYCIAFIPLDRHCCCWICVTWGLGSVSHDDRRCNSLRIWCCCCSERLKHRETDDCASQCTVWVKKIPPTVFWNFKFFPKRLRIFNQFFKHLLCDHFYTRLQIFIQLSPTLTKLCRAKRDHLAKFYISL